MTGSSAPVVDATPAHALTSVSHISLMHRPFGAPRIHMDENASSGAAPDPGGETNVRIAPEGTGTDLSVSEAARALQAARKPRQTAAPVEPKEAPVEADPESPARGDTDPDIDPTLSEEPEGTEPEAEKLPPIARPRSWSKDDEEDWQTLPRARQEKIAAREQARDQEIRRGQNDTAEKLKGLTAKEQQAEQARQQYEEKAKGALKVLEREQLQRFPDIRSMEDVNKLLETDPLRYLQWDAHQKELVAATMASREAERRSAEAKQGEWAKHVQEANAKAAELIPELADKEKGPALQKRAFERLVELGFTPAELNDLASGKEKISVYDPRLQQLVKSDLDLADLKAANAKAKAALKAVPATVPPVQRPGTTQPRGAVESVRVRDLDTKLNNSGSINDGLALLKAQRAARSRST